VCLVVVGF